VLSCS
jgi:hypothetical protein